MAIMKLLLGWWISNPRKAGQPQISPGNTDAEAISLGGDHTDQTETSESERLGRVRREQTAIGSTSRDVVGRGIGVKQNRKAGRM
mmetsp:Transcript_52572/g.78540  ORF Transcript_52572/g.78540 Transcript_52572/m.78540 type:complete len:85 (+) Transcript_52572:265-519(+)